MKLQSTEKELENLCCAIARSKGIAAVKLEKNGNKGIPDRVFIFKGGKCIFVEFKRPDGKGIISQEQHFWANYIGKENHFFINNVSDFERYVIPITL